MTNITPGASGITNQNPTPLRIERPLPSNSTPGAGVSHIIAHPVPLPVDRTSTVAKENALTLKTGTAIIGAAAGTGAAVAAGTNAYTESQKVKQTQGDFINSIYDRCRTDTHFTTEDAVFHLETKQVPQEEIFRVLRATARIPALPPGKKNVLFQKDGVQTVGVCDDPRANFSISGPDSPKIDASNIAVPSNLKLSNQSFSTMETISDVGQKILKMIEEKPKNPGNQLTSNGQILISDHVNTNEETSSFDREIPSVSEADCLASETEQTNSACYMAVNPGNAVASSPPKRNYSNRYEVLAILFAGLVALFIVIGKHLWDLQEKITEYEKIMLDDKLIEILVKSKQGRLSIEKTREWLGKDCFFSKETIDEIMINLEKS